MLLLRYPDFLLHLHILYGIARAHGAGIIGVPRKLALEVVQRAALEEVAAARFLLLEDEHVAALGLAAVLEAVQSGVDVQHGQELGAHLARVLGPDDLVLVDVEALEAHLIVARAAVPLLARADRRVRRVAVRAVEDHGDEDQGNDPPRPVQHRSRLCITVHHSALECVTGAWWSHVQLLVQVARAVAPVSRSIAESYIGLL